MANVPGDIEDPFGVPPRQQESDRGNAVAQWYDSVREAPEWRYIFVDILLKVCESMYVACRLTGAQKHALAPGKETVHLEFLYRVHVHCTTSFARGSPRISS